MAKLKSVIYVDASSLEETNKEKLGIKEGLVAVETYNNIRYEIRSLKTGIIDYILDGEPEPKTLNRLNA